MVFSGPGASRLVYSNIEHLTKFLEISLFPLITYHLGRASTRLPEYQSNVSPWSLILSVWCGGDKMGCAETHLVKSAASGARSELEY